MLILDEVQTGLGRTGRFLALEHWGLEPDLVTVSKALSGGYVPAGAMLAAARVRRDVRFDGAQRRATLRRSAAATWPRPPAWPRSTCSSASASRRAARLGELLLELTRPLVERFEIVRDVRGLGLIWGIESGPPAGRAARRAWEAIERFQPGLFAQLVIVPLFHDHRILTQVAGHHMNVIKALPPLVIEESELRRFAAALEDVLATAEKRFFRSYATLGVELGRRTLGARWSRIPIRGPADRRAYRVESPSKVRRLAVYCPHTVCARGKPRRERRDYRDMHCRTGSR